jgi:alcohol dehydrogenase (cytochrome c)
VTWATGIDLKTGRPNFVPENRPGNPTTAADAKTGKIVWEFQTGSGVVAPPTTWMQNGEQYVSVVSGWGGAVPLWGGDVATKVNFLEQGGMVWVFKIPKSGGDTAPKMAKAN